MSGRKFGVKTSKTLRKCNFGDQAKELDAFVIKHCAQYEGPELFDGDKIMVTDKTHEKVDKNERKRNGKRAQQEETFINMDELEGKSQFEKEVDTVKENNDHARYVYGLMQELQALEDK
jgi:hypothetical protein